MDKIERNFGCIAGTTLNAILRDMTKKAEDGKMAIGDMSVSLYDGEGNMRDLGDIRRNE